MRSPAGASPSGPATRSSATTTASWSKARLLELLKTGLTIEEKERQIAARIDRGERIADMLQFRALLESNAS